MTLTEKRKLYCICSCNNWFSWHFIWAGAFSL